MKTVCEKSSTSKFRGDNENMTKLVHPDCIHSLFLKVVKLLHVQKKYLLRECAISEAVEIARQFISEVVHKWCICAFLEALSSFWTSRSHWSKQITCKNMTKVSPDQIQCIKYAVIFAHKGKNNTLFGTVKGLFVLVCTHNINKTLCVSKIKKTNRMQFLPSRSWKSAS